MEIKDTINEVWKDRSLLKQDAYSNAIKLVIEEVDKGRLRVAEPQGDTWVVNEWVKQAILLYFGIQPMQTWELAPFEFHDKMLLKSNYAALGVRAVPHAVARYGAYLAKNVILMPSYVNIGAFVDEGTMVDTWATVGSCAQIGKGVHLSGGVGIGGVLEPLQASPVIIEDGCFIGSRCIVVEGVHVEKEAVLGANVVLTQSTKIIDVKYFSGLTEHGFTIIGFLLQHEEGGEIRDVTMEINLAKMEFVIKRNSYFSSGKEPYYYLKKGNSIIKK